MELDVLSQLEGSSTWNNHITCIVTNGICSFTTNHATTYIVNGDGSISGYDEIDINVEVQDTLSMDCYDKAGVTGDFDVSIGTVANPGYVTAGIPAVGQSTCNVTTNDDQGYYLQIENSTNGGDAQGGIEDVLRHEDPNNPGTWYGIEESGLTKWDWNEAGPSGSTTIDWDTTNPTGLGFSIMNIPENDETHNALNDSWTTDISGGTCPEGTASDTNIYAGIPNTAETITAVTAYNANSTVTDICYKVDVPPTQQSGIYTGQVTYTATSDASSYYN
jgi:hypothetical protein